MIGGKGASPRMRYANFDNDEEDSGLRDLDREEEHHVVINEPLGLDLLSGDEQTISDAQSEHLSLSPMTTTSCFVRVVLSSSLSHELEPVVLELQHRQATRPESKGGVSEVI